MPPSPANHPPDQLAFEWDRETGLIEGTVLADAGAQLALDADAVTRWRAAAQQHLDQLVVAGEPFTADDVTAAVGEPPHPNAMGGLFRANRDRIVAVGYTPTTRKAGHARVIRVWKAKEATT